MKKIINSIISFIYYRDCKVEAFGLTIMEALILGIPVISTTQMGENIQI